ncbi:hypothetical protein F5887DRAFT_1076905 [Amanita rubescens]|nr:hypothetical protein F5887DRAFT_1076905 [Amanita rubescens]
MLFFLFSTFVAAKQQRVPARMKKTPPAKVPNPIITRQRPLLKYADLLVDTLPKDKVPYEGSEWTRITASGEEDKAPEEVEGPKYYSLVQARGEVVNAGWSLYLWQHEQSSKPLLIEKTNSVPYPELELNYTTTKGEEDDLHLLSRHFHYGMQTEDVYDRIKKDIMEEAEPEQQKLGAKHNSSKKPGIEEVVKFDKKELSKAFTQVLYRHERALVCLVVRQIRGHSPPLLAVHPRPHGAHDLAHKIAINACVPSSITKKTATSNRAHAPPRFAVPNYEQTQSSALPHRSASLQFPNRPLNHHFREPMPIISSSSQPAST